MSNMRASKPCGHPGCRALVNDGTNRCPAHKVEAWRRRDDAPFRIRGNKLTTLREALFRDEPLCRECAKAGRVTLAVIRDHIVPLSVAGVDLPDNSAVQPLCASCSDKKTQAESLAARMAK